MFSDIIDGIEKGNIALLSCLLDQITAFDTVDHGIIKQRLTRSFGIKYGAIVVKLLPHRQITVCAPSWCYNWSRENPLWSPPGLGTWSVAFYCVHCRYWTHHQSAWIIAPLLRGRYAVISLWLTNRVRRHEVTSFAMHWLHISLDVLKSG